MFALDSSYTAPSLSESGRLELASFLLDHPQALLYALADFPETSLPSTIAQLRKDLETFGQWNTRPPKGSHKQLQMLHQQQRRESQPHFFPTPPPEVLRPGVSRTTSLLPHELELYDGDHDDLGNDSYDNEMIPGNHDNEQPHESTPSQADDENDYPNNDPTAPDNDDNELEEPEDHDEPDNEPEFEPESEEEDLQLFDDIEDDGFVGGINYINVFGGNDPIPILPGGVAPVVVGPDRECHRDALKARRRRREATRPYEARATPPPVGDDQPSNQNQEPVDIPGSPASRLQTNTVLQTNTTVIQDPLYEFIISALCSAAQHSLVDERGEVISLEVHKLIKLVLLGPDLARPSSLPSPNLNNGTVESVLAAAILCDEGQALESGMSLAQYIRRLEFVAQVQKFQRNAPHTSRSSLFEEVANIAQQNNQGRLMKNVMAHDYSLGVRVAHLMAAGTPYILFLLSTCRLKASIKKTLSNHISALHSLIRCPDDSAAGTLIKESFIPAIAQLRQKYPLSTSVLFQDVLGIISAKSPMPNNLWDVYGFDEFLENINFETFIKPRDPLAWAPALVDVDQSNQWNINQLLSIHQGAEIYALSVGSLVRTLYQATTFDHSAPPSIIKTPDMPKLRLWDNVAKASNLFVITTQFDPLLNKSVAYDKTEKSRREFTIKHRKWAAEAKVSSSKEMLKKKLQSQLSKGRKVRANQYALIDGEHFDGQILRIDDKDGNLVALFIGTMPSDLRKNALAAIELAFPGEVKFMDSSTVVHYKFTAYHFSYYNRYSKKGTTIPDNVHPSDVQSAHIHTTPRASRELLENLDRVEIITAAFRPLFDWIYAQLKEILPSEFTMLEAYADILPLGEPLPLHPFTGFVANLNVRTIVHRDGCDKDICLIFQFSEGSGGEVILVEPGMVFRLRSGDGLVFKSRHISHLNANFIGKRVSFVFHTDAYMDVWMKDRNDWGSNVFMKSHLRPE